jgi:nucleotide-binding universal stress UspA family protein
MRPHPFDLDQDKRKSTPRNLIWRKGEPLASGFSPVVLIAKPGWTTMLKTILVTVAGTAQTRPALDTAIVLGRAFGAHIECLRIHPDPGQVLAQAAGVDMGSGLVVPEMLQAFREEDARRTTAARNAFEKICDRETIVLADRAGAVKGMSAAWLERTGDEVEEVVARAHFNDLVVVEHPSGGGGFPPLAAGSVLFGSGRPMLVAPPKSPSTVTGKIAVAWKDSPESTKALAAALPLLSRAAEVLVIGVDEDRRHRSQLSISLDNVIGYLGWHGIPALRCVVEPSEDSAAESMLAAAHEAKADLLVMGGYGHSRLRELIFGGFTRHVLNGVSLPVLLAH